MSPDPILEAFDRRAARSPERPLVLSPDRSVSTGEIADRSRTLAAELAGLRCESGALVAFAAPTGASFLAGLLAVHRAGMVPLLLDAALAATEGERIATALGSTALLVAAGPALADSWRIATLAGPPCPLPADTALVKLTSGSTGAPRGVAVSADAALADDLQLRSTMGIRDDDRLLATIPLSHSYGLVSLALPALTVGTPLVTTGGAGPPLAPLAVARAAAATFFPTVPAWLSALVRLSTPPAWPPSLRLVTSAGAPLLPETAARFHDLFGRRVHAFYGATECGGITYDREGGAAERGTVGTPVEGVRVELDPADGRVVVLSRAVATRQIPDPDPAVGPGRFVTGDLGAWENGELRLRGRADDLVIVRGRNVDPREVETVLRSLAGVEDVVVVGVRHPETGEPALRAVIACRPGALDYDAVRRFAGSHLADHKIPRSVVFVAALPRTERGKLDRPALLRLNG